MTFNATPSDILSYRADLQEAVLEMHNPASQRDPLHISPVSYPYKKASQLVCREALLECLLSSYTGLICKLENEACAPGLAFPRFEINSAMEPLLWLPSEMEINGFPLTTNVSLGP
jgi:hypothetical protein